MTSKNSISGPHLFSIARSDIRLIANLEIPPHVCVTSTSAIKTNTVRDTLRIMWPGSKFNVLGIKVPSDVDEQPLGQMAIDGALNRLQNGMRANRRGVDTTAWFSIENGLFRVGRHGASHKKGMRAQGALQFSEGADLCKIFDPSAEYEDRAVAAIHLPGHSTIVQISPASEAVLFPSAAVRAAHDAAGGFRKHTAGSKLAELGIVRDKQNPHAELTEGRLPRQDQMARVMIRALARVAQN